MAALTRDQTEGHVLVAVRIALERDVEPEDVLEWDDEGEMLHAVQHGLEAHVNAYLSIREIERAGSVAELAEMIYQLQSA